MAIDRYKNYETYTSVSLYSNHIYIFNRSSTKNIQLYARDQPTKLLDVRYKFLPQLLKLPDFKKNMELIFIINFYNLRVYQIVLIKLYWNKYSFSCKKTEILPIRLGLRWSRNVQKIYRIYPSMYSNSIYVNNIKMLFNDVWCYTTKILVTKNRIYVYSGSKNKSPLYQTKTYICFGKFTTTFEKLFSFYFSNAVDNSYTMKTNVILNVWKI